MFDQPSVARRAALWAYLDSRRLLTTRHHVVGPQYVPVEVSFMLDYEKDGLSSVVNERARQTILDYFHPLIGGSDHKGWPFGRSVYISEVYELLDKVPGVDFAEQVMLNGNDEAVPLAAHQLVQVTITILDSKNDHNL